MGGAPNPIARRPIVAGGRYPWLLLIAPLPPYARLWLNMLDGRVAIVSGLDELFADDDLVRASLAGLADALGPAGHLSYAGQPWAMRRRARAERDALVRADGFEKVDRRIDRWGIFTVSIAKGIGTIAQSEAA